ncbi:TPA: DUF723 domain-containing protein [Neisseria meningitidis]
MGKRMTFDTAKSRFQEKFPHLELLEFSGIYKPSSVRCPTHGVVQLLYYDTAIKSKYGCPECGKLKMKENTPPQNQKPVSILDTATGETLTFPSVQAAAKALNTPCGSIRTKLDGRSNPDNLVCNRYKVLL